MSENQGFNPSDGVASYDGLDLGPTGYVPTPPADRYVPLGPDAGYSAPAPNPSPAFGAPSPTLGTPGPAQAYADPSAAGEQTPYPMYDPSAPLQPQYPVMAYTPQPPPGQVLPGQVVQTAYGTVIAGEKSKVTAGLLGILLGVFGVGQFYRGNAGMGVIQLVVSLISCGIGALWGLIEGILVLVAEPGSPMSLDSQGRLMT